MNSASRPERSEATAYYFKYIDLVPDGDICVGTSDPGMETHPNNHGFRRLYNSKSNHLRP